MQMADELEKYATGRIAGRKVKAVLEGATRVFLDRGFSAASMDDVAATAGVSKRTLYQYFSSKEALFVAVVRGRVDEMIQDVEAVGAAPGTISLLALADRLVQRIQDPEAVRLYRMVIAEAGRMPELGRTIDSTIFSAAIAEIEHMLVRIAAQRRVPLENPAFAADIFLSLLVGVSQMRALFGVDFAPGSSSWGGLENRVACFERAFGLCAQSNGGERPSSAPRAKSRPASA